MLIPYKLLHYNNCTVKRDKYVNLHTTEYTSREPYSQQIRTSRSKDQVKNSGGYTKVRLNWHLHFYCIYSSEGSTKVINEFLWSKKSNKLNSCSLKIKPIHSFYTHMFNAFSRKRCQRHHFGYSHTKELPVTPDLHFDSFTWYIHLLTLYRFQ